MLVYFDLILSTILLILVTCDSTLRFATDYLEKCCLSSWVCTKCPVGAPEYTYGRGLFKLLKKAGANLNNWHELAHGKRKLRKMIYDT